MELVNREVLNEELYNAAGNGDLSKVTQLLHKGADPNYHPYYGKWTSLHAACANNHPGVVKALVKSKASVTAKDRIHYTPLHVACMYGYMECVRAFDEYKDSYSADVQNEKGLSPLGLAVERQQMGVVRYLVTKLKVSPRALRDEILELGCKNGDLEFVKLMMKKFDCDPEKQKEVVLSLGCQAGDLEMITIMVDKYHCDPNAHLNVFGDTPMRLAVQNGRLGVVEYLAGHKVDPGDCLILACTGDFQHIVNYMLASLNCDPNIRNENGETPLSHAKSNKVIQLLLKYGAIAEDAYQLYRQSLGNLSAEDPLVNPVKMFVLGFQKEGKTTLIQSMQQERKRDSLFSYVTSKEINERTPGIVSKVFKSRVFGDVQFLDFAGQKIYYNSHAAFIKSSIVSYPPLFLLVVGLHRTCKEIESNISSWMIILKNQCAQIQGKAPLIVVGSHDDELKGRLDEKLEKEKLILRCIESYQSFFGSFEFFSMDCRICNTVQIKQLREMVSRKCKELRSQLSVSVNAHMFLLFLLKNYPIEVAVTLETARSRIETEIRLDKSKKYDKLLPFLPTNASHIVKICEQLNDNGHILYLPNSLSVGEGYIVIDKAALLTRINGTLFAPADFKQHRDLASKSGIIPLSKLAKEFPDFDNKMLVMLVGFMTSLELAMVIGEPISIDTLRERYLFCPTLVSSGPSETVWEKDDSFKYHFGWVLSCTDENGQFSHRLIQVLLLRLAQLNKDSDAGLLSSEPSYSIWKMGICWGSGKGVVTMVEIDANCTSILLRMRAHDLTVDFLELRYETISKVRNTVKDVCSSVSTKETLVRSIDIVRQGTSFTEFTQYCFDSVAKSVVKKLPSVASGHTSTKITDLLHVEVYENLGESILQGFFNNESSGKPLSDCFVKSFASVLSTHPEQAEILYQAIANLREKNQPPSITLYEELKAWSESGAGTYLALGVVLDRLSVFRGRDPLELAGVETKLFSEDDLPNPEEIIQERSFSSLVTRSLHRGSLPCDIPGTILRTDSISSHYSAHSAFSSSFDSYDPEQSFSPCVSSPPTSLDKRFIFSKRDSDGRVLTIEDLKRRNGISDFLLDSEIDEKDLHSLAGCFDNVEDYLDVLKLTEGQQTDVKDIVFHKKSTQIGMTKALKLWRQPNPPIATYRNLLILLLELRKGDVACKCCDLLCPKFLPGTPDVGTSNSLHVSQLDEGSSTDPHDRTCHLKVVRSALWEVRADWWNLGIELGMTVGTCDTFQVNNRGRDMADKCFTDMLVEWLQNDPQLEVLLKALESPVIHRADIAEDLKGKIKNNQLKLW